MVSSARFRSHELRAAPKLAYRRALPDRGYVRSWFETMLRHVGLVVLPTFRWVVQGF